MPQIRTPRLAIQAPLSTPSADTTSVTLLRLFIDLLGEGSPEVRHACQQLDIDLADLKNPAFRLPRLQTLAMIERLVALSSDPDLGLKAGRQVHPAFFHSAGFAMMSSATLHDALARLVRFLPLFDDTASGTLQAEGAHFRGHSIFKTPLPVRQMSEAGLTALFTFCRFLTGGQPLRVLEIEFMQAAPPDEQLASRQLAFGGAQLHYGAPRMSLLLHGDDLRRPLRTASPLLSSLHDYVAERELESLGTRSLLSLKVRQIIAEQLGCGHAPTLGEVAINLHTTPRTLQRALSLENAQFSQLLDGIRHDVAHLQLRHSSISLKELSFELGFREISSFHRACVRWFGMTPLQYRSNSTSS